MDEKSDGAWQKHNTAGSEAYERGDYAEAETHWVKALGEAERFDKLDPRLHMSMLSLALLYQTRGKHTEANDLFRRSRALWDEESLNRKVDA